MYPNSSLKTKIDPLQLLINFDRKGRKSPVSVRNRVPGKRGRSFGHCNGEGTKEEGENSCYINVQKMNKGVKTDVEIGDGRPKVGVVS